MKISAAGMTETGTGSTRYFQNAGVDRKVVQEMVGHASIGLTSDTYTSVLPEVAHEAAEAAARLVSRQSAPGLTRA
ncbi:hypothetical protein [Salinispora oceanensis]|uniref:hypothetical protein n=1 Tax=Salinispora oceanensis TaxID=1050199 RepID=UPI00037A74E5|nr:hypothetical protein [Salinispora oceanensis]